MIELKRTESCAKSKQWCCPIHSMWNLIFMTQSLISAMRVFKIRCKLSVHFARLFIHFFHIWRVPSIVCTMPASLSINYIQIYWMVLQTVLWNFFFWVLNDECGLVGDVFVLLTNTSSLQIKNKHNSIMLRLIILPTIKTLKALKAFPNIKN